MKKKILLLFITLTTAITMAQRPVLEGTWYLHSYEYDLGDFIEIKDISPHITPTIIFDENYNFAGQVCNEYGGAFTYNEAEDNFTLLFFDLCLCGTCNNPPQSHVDLENDYFNFFTPVTHEYYFFTDAATGEKVFQLEAAPGFILTYRDTAPFLAVSENNFIQIFLFPNPTENILNIQARNGIIEKTIIFSVTGEKLKETIPVENKIDVSTLVEGIYFIEVVSGQNRSIQKFIKN